MAFFKKQKTDLNKNIFEGTSIQQAVNAAAEALKVPADQISYDVISYGSTGVFGLMASKRAKIRVRSNIRIKEKALSATEKYWREIQDEQEKFASRELNREKQKESAPEETKTENGKNRHSAKNNANGKKSHNAAKQPRAEHEKRASRPVEAAPKAPPAEQKERAEDLDKAPRRRSRSRKRAPRPENGAMPAAAPVTVSPDTPQEPLSGQLLQAYDVLKSMAAYLLDAPFELVYTLTDKKVVYIFRGENLSALIGKNGNTKRSLQLVADRIVNKSGQNKFSVNVVVDTARQNKSKRFLTSLAKKKADVCRETKEEISLGFMNAYERCIVHIALKKDPDVDTKSVGEGAQKEIFVVPARERQRPPADA